MALKSVNCGDEVCVESETFSDTCTVYVGDPGTCNPPCMYDGCQIEEEYDVICKTWICHKKPPSTTSMAALTTSVTFNIVFSLMLICGIIFIMRMKKRHLREVARLSAGLAGNLKYLLFRSCLSTTLSK